MTDATDWPAFLRHRASGDSSFPITDEQAEQIAGGLDQLKQVCEVCAAYIKDGYGDPGRAMTAVLDAMGMRDAG